MSFRLRDVVEKCTKYGQLLICTAMIFSAISLILIADSDAQINQTLELKMLNPNYKTVDRTPSNFVPSDEVEVRPFEQKLWVNTVLERDSSGILSQTKGNLESWQKTEDYARLWNVESTGLYNTPSMEYRKNMIQKNMLKYLDKKLAGEIKHAEEGSTLHSVGQVHQALRPNTKVQVSENIKIRFKARVLQATAIVKVENPWVDYNASYYAMEGQFDMHLKKEIKPIRVTSTVDYNVTGESWVAAFSRPINEHWTARYSSTQSDKEMAFTENSDKRYEVLYNLPF